MDDGGGDVLLPRSRSRSMKEAGRQVSAWRDAVAQPLQCWGASLP